MAIKKTVAKLKSLYKKFEVETEKYKKKEIQTLEKQYTLPAVLKEYYLKIGIIDSSIEMEAFEMYDIKSLRMFTKENSKEIKYKYNGDYFIFATEIAGVCEYAIKKEDMELDNPPLYTNPLGDYPNNDFYWIPASVYNSEDECFDTLLDFFYEIAKSIGVDPDPRNNEKNIQLVKDVLQGKRPETDITDEVIKDITELGGLDSMQFENWGAIRNLANLNTLSLFKSKGIDFDPILSLAKLSRLSIRYCDLDIDIKGIEQLVKLKSLDLSRSIVRNVSLIKHLSKLEYLSLSSCGLDDISFVAEMHNLIFFEADDNQITTLPAFEGKYKLTSLNLNGNKLSNLKNIQTLDLHVLYVSKNPLTDISDLKDSSYTSYQVEANNCLLEDISVLTDIEHFHTFKARNNKIKNLPQLTKKNKFGTLELENNLIEDLSPLVDVGYLFYLRLDGNPLKDISAMKDITKIKEISVDKDLEIPEGEDYQIKEYTDCKVIKMNK